MVEVFAAAVTVENFSPSFRSEIRFPMLAWFFCAPSVITIFIVCFYTYYFCVLYIRYTLHMDFIQLVLKICKPADSHVPWTSSCVTNSD